MTYLGDYAEDETLHLKFTTRDSTGAPSTLGGTPAISVYTDANTTQSTAGITLTADFDGVTGLNQVTVDLSADAFYATAQDYQIVITTGTVDSISVVGEVVGQFSIENRSLEEVRTNAAAILVDTSVIGTAGAGLTSIPWNSAWDSEVQSEVNDALVALHLDHMFAADYDPASPPGVATALLNELIESDGGVSRFTANALELSPTDVNVTSMAADTLTASALATDAVGEIWDSVVETEGSYTAQQVLSIALAILAGRTSSGGTVFNTPNNNAARASATTDGSNNRTGMTLTPSS